LIDGTRFFPGLAEPVEDIATKKLAHQVLGRALREALLKGYERYRRTPGGPPPFFFSFLNKFFFLFPGAKFFPVLRVLFFFLGGRGGLLQPIFESGLDLEKRALPAVLAAKIIVEEVESDDHQIGARRGFSK